MRLLFIILGLNVFLLTRGYTNWTTYECLSVSLFLYFILTFVDNLGKKLVILDIAILISIITCLLLPIAGYHHFNALNIQSRVWMNFMRVPSDEYYSFMLPATIAMMIGMKIPIYYRKQTYKNQEQYMANVKSYLKNSKWQGLILVSIGLIASVVKNYVPAGIGFVFFLLNYLMFVGIFYCLYSDLPLKKTILIGVFSLLILRSIMGGMFGEMIFMGALTVILIVLGQKISFGKKFIILLIGIFGIALIQSIKPAFRKQTWYGRSQGNQLSIFANVLTKNVSDPSMVFNDQRMLFVSYGRFNQGQIISNVLYSVPSKYPFANGETIITSLAASIVPRVIWPDKPESGGAYNFQRFLGIKLKGWSANISPFGDAWGNFGRIGGIVFMLCFGLLFNFFLTSLLRVAVNYPSLILWFPYLFFYSVSIENDVMSMMNSFVKAALFTYLIYKFFPLIFKLKI